VLDRLIIFTRYPEPGQVKTRLIPLLGPQRAADLHRRLAVHTLAWAHELAREDGVELVVHFDGGDEQLMEECFGNTFLFIPQGSGDLGERLTAALADICGPTIVIGTDCPALTPDQVRGAILALRCADVVLGPATDGGYYLVGLKAPQPQLFTDIPWGTDRVCETTRQRARTVDLSVQLLQALPDIDRPEDISLLPDHIRLH
jgi:uncharacterized protein